MKRAVLSLIIIAFVIYYALLNLPLLNCDLYLDEGQIITPSIERYARRMSGRNRLSFPFISSKWKIEDLAYVKNLSIGKGRLSVDYKDGLILSDGNSYFFYDQSSFYPISKNDTFSLLQGYLLLSLKSEVLSYILDYPSSSESREILSLLMDISKQNRYNGKVIKKAEYFLSSNGDCGELRLYGESGFFTLSVLDFSDHGFILSSISAIDSMNLRESAFFEISSNTFFRRYL